MHSKNDNIEIMINDKADEVIEDFFDSLIKNIKSDWKNCDFIFDCVHVLYYKCHKINPNRGGSYIDSSDWIKNKKTAINPFNKKDKCFQYAVTVALNDEEIGRH